MARKLWRPATEGDGIPLEVLRTFCQALCDWRTEFFDKVSVHMNDYSGDFVTVRCVALCIPPNVDVYSYMMLALPDSFPFR